MSLLDGTLSLKNTKCLQTQEWLNGEIHGMGGETARPTEIHEDDADSDRKDVRWNGSFYIR